MRYRYETYSMNNEMVASVKELATDQWVAIGINVDDAKKLTKHLNLGGGFDGHTPSFFCQKIKQLAT